MRLRTLRILRFPRGLLLISCLGLFATVSNSAMAVNTFDPSKKKPVGNGFITHDTRTQRVIKLEVRPQYQAIMADARAKLLAGQYAEAIKMLQAPLASEKLQSYESYSFINMIAGVYAQQGRFQAAYDIYRDAAERLELPKVIQEDLQYKIANAAFALGDYEQAASRLKKWLRNKDNADKQEAFVMLGQAYFNLGQYPDVIKALRSWQKRHAGDNANEQAYALQGQAHYKLQQYVKAAKAFELYMQQALKFDLGIEAAWLRLMQTSYQKLGNEQRVVEIQRLLGNTER